MMHGLLEQFNKYAYNCKQEHTNLDCHCLGLS